MLGSFVVCILAALPSPFVAVLDGSSVQEVEDCIKAGGSTSGCAAVQSQGGSQQLLEQANSSARTQHATSVADLVEVDGHRQQQILYTIRVDESVYGVMYVFDDGNSNRRYKRFFYRKNGPNKHYLRSGTDDAEDKAVIDNLVRECTTLFAYATQANPFPRLINCIGDNAKAGGEHFYLKFDNVGLASLASVISDFSSDQHFMLGLFVQVLEGLAFLESLKTPSLIAVLDPNDIRVSSLGRGKFSLQLTNFRLVDSSHEKPTAKCSAELRKWVMQDVTEKGCTTDSAIFAAGAIFVEMAYFGNHWTTGCPYLLYLTSSDGKHIDDFALLSEFSGTPDALADRAFTPPGPMRDAFCHAAPCLSPDPHLRPTAKALLEKLSSLQKEWGSSRKESEQDERPGRCGRLLHGALPREAPPMPPTDEEPREALPRRTTSPANVAPRSLLHDALPREAPPLSPTDEEQLAVS